MSPAQLLHTRSSLMTSMGGASSNYNASLHASQHHAFGQLSPGGLLGGGGADGLVGASPPITTTVVIPPDFASISSLVSEVSRVNQRCSDLETEVEDLKRRDADKNALIDDLSTNMKQLQNVVEKMMNDRDVIPVHVRPDTERGGGGGAAVGSGNSKLPPIQNKKGVSSGGGGDNLAASQNNKDKDKDKDKSGGLNYSTRNKAYKGAADGGGAGAADVSNDLPDDIKKQHKKESAATDIKELVNKEKTLQKKLDVVKK